MAGLSSRVILDGMMSSMQPIIRKQKKTYNEPGHAHFLTFSCYKRMPLLTRDRVRQWVIEAIDAARKKQGIALWAYVLMPEHMHLLVRPLNEQYRIERFLFACKRPVSGKAKRWLVAHDEDGWLERLSVTKGEKRLFRFWQQGGGYDRNLVRTEGLQAVIDYLHANPVRRGLVAEPEEWYWSSAGDWAGAKEFPLPMDPVDV